MPRAPSAAVSRASIASGKGAYSAVTAGSRRTAVTWAFSSSGRGAISCAATIRDSTASRDCSLSRGIAGRLDIRADRTSRNLGDQEAKGTWRLGGVEAWRMDNECMSRMTLMLVVMIGGNAIAPTQDTPQGPWVTLVFD